MKKIMNWVFAATLICGTIVFTSCKDDKKEPDVPTNNNRTVFIEHTRENLKDLAENLNLTSWEIANRINQEFNTAVLNNPEFEKAIIPLFLQKIITSLKPVEEGSELAEKGFQMYATIDLTDFNYRFTMKEDDSGFDVEEADDFEMIINGFNPQTQEKVIGARKLTLKAGGDTFKMLGKLLSTEELAVVLLVPVDFTFTIAGKVNGSWHDGLVGSFKNKVKMSGESEYLNLKTDAIDISGQLTTKVDELPGTHDADSNEFIFNIGNDPVANKAGMNFSFVHNNKNMIKLDATSKYSEKDFDFSQFKTSGSLLDVLVALISDANLEGSVTLNDDLTASLYISDCGKLMKLQREMAHARRHYADEATIEGYTKQLNELLNVKATCEGVNMVIPMQLKTEKLGVDYYAMPAFNFGDEDGFVPYPELLDKECIDYAINIVDHAAEPMAGTIVTVRQLIQFVRTFIMQFGAN